MTIASILLLPIKSKDFVIFYEDSLLGLGVMLMQENVITYDLIKLKPYEINYLTHNLELATVVFVLGFGDTSFIVSIVRYSWTTVAYSICLHKRI